MRMAVATDCVVACGMLVLGCLSGFCQMDAVLDRVLDSRERQPISAARKKNVGCIRNSDKQRRCKWPGWQQRAASPRGSQRGQCPA
jgi:hypothetical protein